MAFLTLLSDVGVSVLVAVLFMSGVFFIARRMRRFDLIDSTWGLVFIVIASTSLIASGELTLPKLGVLLLVTLWGLRLSLHIFRRFRASAQEDGRYVAMRQSWRGGHELLQVFGRIYLTQALLATVVSLPVILFMNAPSMDVSLLSVVGLVFWLVGFTVEAVADRQLRLFIQQSTQSGRLMTAGLWRYSRHPNYFGELLQWWALGIIGLTSPLGWLGLLGPLVLSYLIVCVSGIPPLEVAFAKRTGWTAYKARTSVLIPWFVKKEAR